MKQFFICVDLEYDFENDGWKCLSANTDPVATNGGMPVPLFDVAMSEKREFYHWLGKDDIWRLNFQGAFSLGAWVENSEDHRTGCIQAIFRITIEIVYSKITGCWYIANKIIKEEEIYDV